MAVVHKKHLSTYKSHAGMRGHMLQNPSARILFSPHGGELMSKEHLPACQSHAGMCAQVMDWHDATSSFLPSVIKSVRSSMQRSEYFCRMTAAAERKLTSSNHSSSSSSSDGSGREKTVFHSIVG